MINSFSVFLYESISSAKKYLIKYNPSKSDIDTAVKVLRKWADLGRPRRDHIQYRELWDEIRKTVSRVAANNSLKPGYYWRGTNRKEEVNDLKNGKAIISKNHADGINEKGLSVSKTPATIWAYNYRGGYIVKGKEIGKGSDGEPILDPETVVPVTEYLTQADIMKLDSENRKRMREVEKYIQHAAGLDQHKIYKAPSLDWFLT